MGTELEIKGYSRYGIKGAIDIGFPWVTPPPNCYPVPGVQSWNQMHTSIRYELLYLYIFKNMYIHGYTHIHILNKN